MEAAKLDPKPLLDAKLEVAAGLGHPGLLPVSSGWPAIYLAFPYTFLYLPADPFPAFSTPAFLVALAFLLAAYSFLNSLSNSCSSFSSSLSIAGRAPPLKTLPERVVFWSAI